MLTVEAGGEPLQLLPEKAAFLPAHGALLVADVHIGKAVSFRRWGVPVPRGTTTDTLQRLSLLIEQLPVRRLVFLGDFLHSERAHAPATLAALARWRERHARLAVTLVRGNHDLRAGDPPAALGIEVVDEPLRLGGLALCHHPQPVAHAYALAGHLHPCVAVGRGLDRLRLPCFWLRPALGVLPAFGAFTGMHAVHADDEDRVFAVAEQRVLAVA
ncbi:ligase-associated DNA damage response endonuclease PdeM [Ideonella sp. BN130291]|uniref:ligase-associated DNA damage response endonuclease PdeM n=1 Tax=Ideonella sp. BN130291 TaxID=3112940 RepID=UPI002E25FADF|nr:ligase-associated DNA damage response endonuclease PdeM [Ideonella sp. BN130291]